VGGRCHGPPGTGSHTKYAILYSPVSSYVKFQIGNSSVTEWSVIEAESRKYAERKKKEGRFDSWSETIPTYDLMTHKEIVG
jgi:hypothetical protein